MSTFGDIMPIDEFVEACESGFFIDYDGFGHYANPPMMDASKYVRPSDVLENGPDPNFTHVVWYNK